MQQCIAIKVDYNKNKDKYKPWKGSPYRNCGLLLHQFVDAIMHLTFLSIKNSTMHLIAKWGSTCIRQKKIQKQ